MQLITAWEWLKWVDCSGGNREGGIPGGAEVVSFPGAPELVAI